MLRQQSIDQFDDSINGSSLDTLIVSNGTSSSKITISDFIVSNLQNRVHKISDPVVDIPFYRSNDEKLLNGVQTITRSAPSDTFTSNGKNSIESGNIISTDFMTDGRIGCSFFEPHTNLVAQPKMFDVPTRTSSWVFNNITYTIPTPSSHIDPFGSFETITLVDSGSGSIQHSIQAPNTFTSATGLNASIFVRPISTIVDVTLELRTTNVSEYSDFNLTNSSQSITFETANAKGTIKKYPFGWFKLSISSPATGTANFNFFLRNNQNSVRNYAASLNADGLGTGLINVFVPQVSAGTLQKPFSMTSSGSAYSSIPLVNNINNGSMTISFDLNMSPNADLTNSTFFNFTDGGLNNFRISPSSSYWLTGTATNYTLGLLNSVYNSTNSYIIRYDETKIDVFMNKQLVFTQLITIDFKVFNKLDIGNEGIKFGNCVINNLKVYDFSFSDKDISIFWKQHFKRGFSTWQH